MPRPDDDPEYRLAGLDPLYSSYAKLRVRDILESLEPWGPHHLERPLVHPSSRRIISRVEARSRASPHARPAARAISDVSPARAFRGQRACSRADLGVVVAARGAARCRAAGPHADDGSGLLECARDPRARAPSRSAWAGRARARAAARRGGGGAVAQRAAVPGRRSRRRRRRAAAVIESLRGRSQRRDRPPAPGAGFWREEYSRPRELTAPPPPPAAASDGAARRQDDTARRRRRRARARARARAARLRARSRATAATRTTRRPRAPRARVRARARPPRATPRRVPRRAPSSAPTPRSSRRRGPRSARRAPARDVALPAHGRGAPKDGVLCALERRQRSRSRRARLRPRRAARATPRRSSRRCRRSARSSAAACSDHEFGGASRPPSRTRARPRAGPTRRRC